MLYAFPQKIICGNAIFYGEDSAMLGSRVRFVGGIAVGIVISFTVAGGIWSYAQGSLTPPPGPPTPTMKTLAEIHNAILSVPNAGEGEPYCETLRVSESQQSQVLVTVPSGKRLVLHSLYSGSNDWLLKVGDTILLAGTVPYGEGTPDVLPIGYVVIEAGQSLEAEWIDNSPYDDEGWATLMGYFEDV